MTAISGSLIGHPPFFDANGVGSTTQALSATTTKVAFVFQVEAAAAITELFYSCSAVTSPPVYRISIQGVDAAGSPDGTVKGGGSPASATFTPTATSTFVTLANSYTPARGDFLSIVIEYSSGTIGAGNTATFRYANGAFAVVLGFLPYPLTSTGTFAKSSSGAAHWGYRTATATYGTPIGAPTARTGSATAEVGIKFRLDASYGSTFNVGGARWKGSTWATTQVAWLTLYDGVTVLQQVRLPADDGMTLNSGAHLCQAASFDEVTLSTLNFGQYYYLGLCGSASRAGALTTLDVPTAGDMSAFTLGTDMFFVSRTLGTAATTGAGPVSGDAAWTETPTSRPFMWPSLSDWTEPAASGTVIVNARGTAHLRR
jgi:hypothetical protein